MSSSFQQIQLFNDLIESSKFDIDFIDILRPFFLKKYNVDIHDILFNELIHSDNIITNNDNHSPTPEYIPASPSNFDDDTPIPDSDWHFSDNSSDNLSEWSHDSSVPEDFQSIDFSERYPEYLGTQYINDRFFHEGSHRCRYIMCQSYNFLCGNSYENQPGSLKKCGYQCDRYCELPHKCKGTGFSFSSMDSRDHNATIASSSKSVTKNRISFFH